MTGPSWSVTCENRVASHLSPATIHLETSGLHFSLGWLALLLDKDGVNHQESMILAAQRDALLPKLVSGEIRVGEVENLLVAPL